MQFQAIAVAVAARGYPAEHFITLEKRVQGPEFTHRLWGERPAHVLAHEAPEPLAQVTRLVGDLVQFTGRCSVDQLMQHIGGDKVGFSQPRNETVAAVELSQMRIDRRRD